MVIERFYNQAAAEYQCNVHEFIDVEEERELKRLENLDIRIASLGVG